MYYIYLDWFWPLGTVPFTKFVVIFCKTSYLSISMHLSQKFVNQRQCIFLFWEIHLMSILYHERVSYCLWICVLKNEIKLFLKSLLELILWSTVSYVLCFLLVFYIAQVSAFLLYPPLCYVSLHVFVNNLCFFWYCHEDCDFLFLCVADCYGVFLIMWSVESQMLTSGLADDLLLFVLDFISFFLFPEINIFVDRKSQ